MDHISDALLCEAIHKYLGPSYSHQTVHLVDKEVTIGTRPGDNYLSKIYRCPVNYTYVRA